MPKYEVVGSFAVFGNAPGQKFDADLDEFDERRLIDGGHIRPVGAKAVKADQKEDATNGD